jgi:hypothetical protein
VLGPASRQELYGDLMVPIVLYKLQGEMRKIISREATVTGIDCYVTYVGYLQIYIMKAGSYNSTGSGNLRFYCIIIYWGKKSRGSNSLHVTISGITCTFCEESQRARDCRKYPDVATKLNVIKE